MHRALRIALAAVGLTLAVYAGASLTGGWLVEPPRGRARETSVGDGVAPSPPPRLAVASPRPAAADAGQPVAAVEDGSKTKSLEEIRADIEAHRWAAARSRLEPLAASDPDDATRKALDALREAFERERGKHLAEIAGLRFPKILRADIEAKVADPDVVFVDVQAWMRKDSLDKAFESLFHELQAVDPAAAEGDVKTAWFSRPRTDESWKPIPEGLPVASARVFNRDSWWAGLSKEQRTGACLALFVEKSGLFEMEERNGVKRHR